MHAQLRIVIPAYNEALRIGPVLREYCAHFLGSATIVVVANGSTDDTLNVVRQAQREFNNLEILEIRRRVGKGGAVRAGFQTGTEPFLGFTDADGSTSAVEFERLYRSLRDGDADAVIGSRWLPDSRITYAQGLSRRFVSRGFNLLTRALFGLRFADTQCGSKIFKRTALSHVNETLEHAGFAFDVELLWALRRKGNLIIEVPIAWNDTAGSKVQLLRTSWSMFASVVRLRLQNTWMWRVRFLSEVAQGACAPVRTSRRVLVLGGYPNTASAELFAALLDAGFQAVHAREELASWWQRSRSLNDASWSLRLAFFAWYTFVSRRNYDAVVEFAQAKPWFVPAFSIKPTFLIKTNRSRPSPAYRLFYRRSVEIDVERQDRFNNIASAITLIDTWLYPAVFIRGDRENMLCYRDPASGLLEQLTLQ
ncbi:MAG TPA: dolichyl-phosphate beta-glucosyltransferase [Candidatus Rubrimentiphilum sp.]|nr:dolichyl-phosphate beta-glucosyltransferase [Candidatus Rubrimentiphilum sp.]